MSSDPPGKKRNRINPEISDVVGVASLPRKSGELVFHSPWERRVFALAVALSEQGFYKWDDFRERLIAEISRAEQAGRHEGKDTAGSSLPMYYEHWLAAFEKLLVEKNILSAEEAQAVTHPPNLQG